MNISSEPHKTPPHPQQLEAVWTCLNKVDSTFKIYHRPLGGYNDPQKVYR